MAAQVSTNAMLKMAAILLLMVSPLKITVTSYQVLTPLDEYLSEKD
jgi:hypothetical protein